MDLMNMLVTSQYLHSNSGGASTQMQEKTVDIAENGTVEIVPDEGYVLSKVVANVEVSSGGDEGSFVDAIIEGSVTEIVSNAGRVRSYAFQACSALTSINFPSAESIGSWAFRACSALTSIDFPSAESIGSYAFVDCSALTSINFPSATHIKGGAFWKCNVLTSVDFPSVTHIESQTFQDCSALTTVILRSESLCALKDTDAFTNTPIASGTGYIYVPAALVDSYKSATNWSNYASQFRALEDYTVDGTTTGELDETKI